MGLDIYTRNSEGFKVSQEVGTASYGFFGGNNALEVGSFPFNYNVGVEGVINSNLKQFLLPVYLPREKHTIKVLCENGGNQINMFIQLLTLEDLKLDFSQNQKTETLANLVISKGISQVSADFLSSEKGMYYFLFFSVNQVQSNLNILGVTIL